MGEVYKACDTRLARTVAIKVLPADAATDVATRARFEREARVIAALSHPHICVVHDVGHQDGIDYLVMELLGGETLAERLARAKGPLPLDEVLRIGIAIADALDKAHRAGIVHRDLKPANVMLTKSGPKLLDFGLAKLHGTASPVSLSNETAATTAGPATAKGTILGTIHYMAPEQLEGREADTRTDIWALGALLYEMATGRRPFSGESAASIIGAILKDTPAPLAARQPLTPLAFEHVVARCLEKDPDERWQSVRDVQRELAWSASARHDERHDGLASGVLGAAHSATPGLVRLPWTLGAIASIAAAVLAIPATRHLREAPAILPETRLEVGTPTTNDRTSFALSPDGRQIVFVAEGDGAPRLWLRPLERTAAQPLAGTEGATSPFWSPDSRSVGFFADGLLKRLDMASTTPHTVAAAVNSRGGTWNQDGVILFAAGTGVALSRVPASGGEATAATTLDRQSSHRYPFFLPDGKHFLFFAQGSSDKAGIFLGALDSTETSRLTPADTAAVYLPSGWLVWQRDGALVAQPLDVTARRLLGEARILSDSVASDAGGIAGGRSSASVSMTGLVAYRAGGASRRQLTWFDRSGTVLGTLGGPDEGGLRSPSLSPDGLRAAVTRVAQGNTDIWIIDGARAGRFTFDMALDRFPMWSPDGRWIAFDSNRLGQRDLYRKESGGAGAEELLLGSAETKMPLSWSPDGRFLLFVSGGAQSGSDLWVLPMVGEHAPRVFLKTRFRETQGRFSPDGRWVAYQSDESGRPEIYIRGFVTSGTSADVVGPSSGMADTPRQWQVSTAGGISPAWRSDGRELYYLSPAGTLMAAAIDVFGTTIAPRPPAVLFPTRIYGSGVDGGQGVQYNVTTDGRFLINTEIDTVPPPITILQNWHPEAEN